MKLLFFMNFKYVNHIASEKLTLETWYRDFRGKMIFYIGTYKAFLHFWCTFYSNSLIAGTTTAPPTPCLALGEDFA